MIEYYAIRGRSEEDQLWRTFVVLKATDRSEAVELFDQWLRSHQKGCEFTAFKIDDIKAFEFGNASRQDECRAFVSKTVQELTKKTKTKTKTKPEIEAETKQQMLQGAP